LNCTRRTKPSIPNRRVHACIQDGSCDFAISQEEGAAIFPTAKVITGVVARDGMEEIVGLEPLIKVTCRWHLFPIDVAFAAPKDINIKLCLEGVEIMDLGVIEWVSGEPGNIEKGKADVSRKLRMVNGVPKGLFVQKS